MKNRVIYITLILLTSVNVSTLAQHRAFIFEYDSVKCNYNLEQGRISGSYVSWYKNGLKKSEGTLINGYRTGRWIVWDSTGRKRMERIYKNPFEFTRIFPPVPTEGPIPLLAENAHGLVYTADSLVEYAVLKAENAIWRHKNWRYLEPVSNDALFRDDRILKLFLHLIGSGQATAYNTVDDRFIQPLKSDSFINSLKQQHIELTGLKLKEEVVFDMGSLLLEYRILGFCPVVKINNQQQDLCWIYFPDIRKYLGKEKLAAKPAFPYIKSLDDLFIFRDFSSVMIKTSINNPFDRYFKDYPWPKRADVPYLSEEAGLSIIEAENDLWIWLSR